MASKKQTAANRRNARKSTGPKTPEGKAASSMNAVRHGLHARTVILRGETQADFDEIVNGLQDEYQPQSISEQDLVNQAAMAQWKLRRAEIHEGDACLEAQTAAERVAIFCKMTLATGRLDRSYLKAYKELERIKAAREPQPDPDPPHETRDEPKETSPGRKPGKEKEDDVNPANLDVFWLDPETGERQYLYRRRDGQALERDQFNDIPTPNADQ